MTQVTIERLCDGVFHVIQHDDDGVSIVLMHTSDIQALVEKAAPELHRAA